MAARGDPVRDFFAVDTAGALSTAQAQSYHGAAALLGSPHVSGGSVDALAAATIATFADAVVHPATMRRTAVTGAAAARASSRAAEARCAAMSLARADAQLVAAIDARSLSRVIVPMVELTPAQQQVRDALSAGSTRLTRTLLNRASSARSSLEPMAHPGAPVPAAIVAASAGFINHHQQQPQHAAPVLYSAAPVAADASGQTSEDQQEKIANRLCTIDGCSKRIRSKGLCKAHGGGRRCTVEGCERSSQSHGLCIRHGGGTRCTHDGCSKAAQSNGLCKAHGGGLRCQFEGCTKATQGGGYCRNHGGGQRCGYDGCSKGAQRGGFCASHGGTRYCQFHDCTKQDRGGGLCAEHGGGKRCKRPACTKPARRQGLCHTHASMIERTEAPLVVPARVLAPAPTLAVPASAKVTSVSDSNERLAAGGISMSDHLVDV